MASRTPADAADALRAGGVIAYPTEGVWGLGCDPANEQAVLRLLAIKQREVAKGLILIASRVEQLDRVIDWDSLSPARRDDVRATWPGPHTWVVPAQPGVPAWITGEHASVAVRVSSHPVVVALCDAFAGALVSTSANRAGQPAVQRLDALDPAIVAAVDAIVEGRTGDLSQPTTIRDARSGDWLR
jgi:L-threonylcarbamoyladenylate synthase